MNNPQFFIKCPVEFQRLCLIYPPSVEEVLNNSQFSTYLKLLTITQEEIEDQYVENGLDLHELVTPFDYILTNAMIDKNFMTLARDAFYFFLHEEVTILGAHKQIVIGDLKTLDTVEKLRVLTADRFLNFKI